MKSKLAIAIVVLSMASAAAVDQKSLLLGVAIGFGVYTAQRGVVPAMKTIGSTSKRATKSVGRGVKRAITGPKKPPVAAQ